MTANKEARGGCGVAHIGGRKATRGKVRTIPVLSVAMISSCEIVQMRSARKKAADKQFELDKLCATRHAGAA
jgi:hypothetical protein